MSDTIVIVIVITHSKCVADGRLMHLKVLVLFSIDFQAEEPRRLGLQRVSRPGRFGVSWKLSGQAGGRSKRLRTACHDMAACGIVVSRSLQWLQAVVEGSKKGTGVSAELEASVQVDSASCSRSARCAQSK